MRRLTLLLCVLALHTAPSAQAPQGRPLQADPVVRLLADIETALASQDPAVLHALASAELPVADRAVFQQMQLGGSGPQSATVRERDRVAEGDGYRIIADLLVGHGLEGRIATWQI
ncbi:MAG TPA: hypothetical protein VJN96_21320, partial [Vicinamibacterales bacterium]|nr:hypothetical protein [Vicinamibacterales bacterium]